MEGVRSTITLSAQGLICLAHYSHRAITEPQEGVLVAAAFNDCGGENLSSRSISQQRRIDRGQPGDEITSEDRRYTLINELNGMEEQKKKICSLPQPDTWNPNSFDLEPNCQLLRFN